jgi:hypothetical protein
MGLSSMVCLFGGCHEPIPTPTRVHTPLVEQYLDPSRVVLLWHFQHVCRHADKPAAKSPWMRWLPDSLVTRLRHVRPTDQISPKSCLYICSHKSPCAPSPVVGQNQLEKSQDWQWWVGFRISFRTWFKGRKHLCETKPCPLSPGNQRIGNDIQILLRCPVHDPSSSSWQGVFIGSSRGTRHHWARVP